MSAAEQAAENDGLLGRIKRSPWWFCTGWWSPWCVIDAVAHCKVPWICRRHDAAQVRWFDKRYPAPSFTITHSITPVFPSWTSGTATSITVTPGGTSSTSSGQVDS